MSDDKHETSASIAAWQTETFGPAHVTPARVIRVREAIWSSMVEALRAASDSRPRPNLSRAIRAAEELAELIEMLAARDDDPLAPVEVADVRIVLEGITASHGIDGQDAVDAKMAINRRRSWSTAGDGNGQHVEEVESDKVRREPGCKCHLEIGDSPCPVHGEESA